MNKPTESLLLPSDMQAWLAYLKAEKRYAQHTLISYEHDLKRLVQKNEAKAVKDYSETDLRLTLAHYHASGMQAKSLARMASCWRSFFHWWSIKNRTDINPAKNLKSPKTPHSLPKALSIEQAQVLLDTPAPDDETGIRDHAMFELLYSCGLRLSELTSLDCYYLKTPDYESESWLNLDEAEVTVKGKGQKTRILPVGSKAIEALKKWLLVRENFVKPQSGNALFLGVRGARITPRVVELQLKKYALQSNINIDMHPHIFRHSFASHILQSSQDLRAVQELLGHANISTTQIYTKLDFQHLAKVYDQAHPRAKKK
ncbi:tyrosine recombinase XerC [Basilea psittacipulmonis]|uniref:Tyrosine recombinase XerC n=1 Tax=Basilea psittacipulmonis DSM 24701 TaxID=1072685 RepID=A0A077DF31_9BURK|nr:tyrosine recombinase XerC [Basilea psittacipulmonis]AIL32721.1 recombinase XerC [Basilea psittacipulmonis DSM 24701]